MSIRPVDMQVIIPKAAEANSINNNSARAEYNQQQQFAQQLNKQVEHDMQTVIQTNKSEKQGTVNKDSRNNQQHSGKGRKSRKGNDKNSEDKKNPESLSLFDVRI